MDNAIANTLLQHKHARHVYLCRFPLCFTFTVLLIHICQFKFAVRCRDTDTDTGTDTDTDSAARSVGRRVAQNSTAQPARKRTEPLIGPAVKADHRRADQSPSSQSGRAVLLCGSDSDSGWWWWCCGSAVLVARYEYGYDTWLSKG